MSYYEVVSLAVQVVVLVVATGTVVVYHRQLRAMERQVAATLAAQSRDTHIRIVEVAIKDADVLDVWRSSHRDLAPVAMKRYLFVNLALSNLQTGYLLGRLNDRQVRAELTEHSDNPHYRSFWKAAGPHRLAALGADPRERRFHELCGQALGGTIDCADDEPPSKRPEASGVG